MHSEFSSDSEKFRGNRFWILLWFREVSESMQKLFWKRSESVLKVNIILKMFWFSSDADWMEGTGGLY